MTNRKPRTRYFSEEAKMGLAEPVFIIKKSMNDGDHFFLTKVIWEYPPESTITSHGPRAQKLKDAIKQVSNLFSQATPNVVEAREIDQNVDGIINGQAGK